MNNDLRIKRIYKKLSLVFVLSFLFLVIAPRQAHAAIAFRAASTVVSAASGSNAIVSKPTGTVDGDIMIAVIFAIKGSSQTPAIGTVPSGWTLITSQANTSSTTRTLTAAYYKVAASEGASYTWSGTSSTISVGIVSYSGAARTSPVDGTPTGASIGSSGSLQTLYTVGSMTTTLNNSMVVVVPGALRSAAESFTAPTGTTPTFNERIDGGDSTQTTWVEASDGILGTAGATGAKTATAANTSYGSVIMFAIKANTAPTFSVQPSASYGSFTRTSANNTPWSLGFTATDAQDTGANALTYTLKRSSDNATIGSITGNFTSGAGQAINVAYNATNLANGSNTLYVTASDGLLSTNSNTFTLLRDDTGPTSSTSISTTPSTVGTDVDQYTVTFTPNDAASTGTNEIAYQIRTASGGGGTLLTSGTSTSGSPKTTATITDSGLGGGSNTRYVRTCDGGNTCTDTSFTVTAVLAPTVSTLAQDTLTPISVILMGQANPNGTATTGYFRINTSNPGSCTDAFGTRLPSSSGTSLGSGSSNVNYSVTAYSGSSYTLTPGTTYYYCAIADNGTSKGYGQIVSFTAPGGGTCSSVPQAGNYTVSSSCVFGAGTATYDGVDNGTGTTNNAQLNIQATKSLNVAPGQTLAYGVINKQGATIIKFRGGVLMKAPVWVPDQDSDNYPDSVGTTGQTVAFNQPAGYMRRNLANGLAADCAVADATKWANQTLYPDFDGDGVYSTSGSSQCIGNTPAGYSLSVGTDCNDNSAFVFQNVSSLGQDGDQDDYYTGSTGTQCVGNSTTAGMPRFLTSSGIFNGASSVSPIVPPGTTNGDTLIAILVLDRGSSTNPTITTGPTNSGFTQIASVNNTTSTTRTTTVAYIKTASSEPSSYTWTFNNEAIAVILRFDRVNTSSALDGTATTNSNGSSGGLTTTFDTGGITTSQANSMLVHVSGLDNGTTRTFTPPTNFNEIVDGGSASVGMWTGVSTFVQPVASTSGTIAAKASSTGGFGGTLMFALKGTGTLPGTYYLADTNVTYETSGTAAGTSDCSDTNGIVQTNRTQYQDSDGDGASISLGSVCSSNQTWGNSSCTTSTGSFAKDASGNCMAITGSNTDCYDLNANAKPSQTSYFTTTRGGGTDAAGNSGSSYDYDCNSSEDQQYPAATSYYNPSVTSIDPKVGCFPYTGYLVQAGSHYPVCGEVLEQGCFGNGTNCYDGASCSGNVSGCLTCSQVTNGCR